MEETYVVNESIAEVEEPKQLKVSELAKANLLTTRKWAKFLAIVWLIGMVIMGIFCVAGLLFITKMGEHAIVVPYFIVIIALYAYPLAKLFGFIKAIKPAVEQNDSLLLDKAVSEIKNFTVYFGVLLIVMLCLYLLLILGFGAIAAIS